MFAIARRRRHAARKRRRRHPGRTGTAPDTGRARRARVRLVATGGTIANRAGGRLTAEELVRLVPQLERTRAVETEQFANLASSELTLDQWLALARRLNELVADRHGARRYRRHLGHRHARRARLLPPPHRPHGSPGRRRRLDAARRRAGLRGRGQPARRVPRGRRPAVAQRGALVVLNDEIHRRATSSKTDAQRLQTFQTPQLRPAWRRRQPTASSTTVSMPTRHTARSEFDVALIARAAPRRRAPDLSGRAGRPDSRGGRRRRARHRPRDRGRRHQRHPSDGLRLCARSEGRRRAGDENGQRPHLRQPAGGEFDPAAATPASAGRWRRKTSRRSRPASCSCSP